MTDPAIVIAYDGLQTEPLRVAAYDQVLAHLSELGWPIRIAVDRHKPYRLAWAVNRIVGQIERDVFVLNYADVIVPHAQIIEAARLAAEAPGQVFAFDQYVALEPDGEKLYPGAPANACMAMQRSAFLEVGGYDETFVGWAMEDREFNDRAGARWPARRVPGRLEHLWHGDRRADGSALETSMEQVQANRAYYRRVQQRRKLRR